MSSPPDVGGSAAPKVSLSEPLDVAIRLLGDRLGTKTRNLITAGVVAKSAYRYVRVQQEKRKAAQDEGYTVTIDATDEIYPDVLRWLMREVPTTKQRSVVVSSSRVMVSKSHGGAPATIDDFDGPEAEQDTDLHLSFGTDFSHDVVLKGHPIRVTVNKPEWSKNESESDDAYQRRVQKLYEKMVFHAQSTQGRDAVVEFLRRFLPKRAARVPRLFVVDRWESWSRAKEWMPRPLESVVLKAGQVEEIVSDMTEFLRLEAQYVRIGLPYHRGYLFRGPAGTGKTSVAKALAGHFGMDVHYIPLPAVKDDATLLNLMQGVDPRSILLLEDIDVVVGARDRKFNPVADFLGVSLSGLLNVLDGFVTPHGLVTIMTTNRADVLDPALIRAGRVDRQFEMGTLDDEQFDGLIYAILGKKILDNGLDISALLGIIPTEVRGQMVPSDVVEILKHHLWNDDGIEDSFRRWANERVRV